MRGKRRDDDLQLLSEMSSREMIFRKDMMPELKGRVSAEQRALQEHLLRDVQDTHAHSKQCTDFLAPLQTGLRNDLQGKEGKGNVKCAGIHYHAQC
jgi:hypothetical protein